MTKDRYVHVKYVIDPLTQACIVRKYTLRVGASNQDSDISSQLNGIICIILG